MQELIIKNRNGLKAVISSYGGRIMSLHVPDRKGILKDIVLGYDCREEYLRSNEKFYGAAIGRYSNRIANASFTINGESYTLEKNDGKNCLHGGSKGFHNAEWQMTAIDENTAELKHFSPDGEGGFPGNLDVRMTYSLKDSNELEIKYFAKTDKPTVVNLTHHSFFNLTGDPLKSVNDHEMQIFADFYTPVSDGLIPTGKIEPVAGTPFDFRKPVKIGDRVEQDDFQLKLGKGYDHNWVLDMKSQGDLKLAARVNDPESGRTMEVFTNEPGIQFYGGNFLNGSDRGKGNIPYHHRTAFCLETQHFPDSPGNENFPSTLLLPSEEYYSVCIYKFTAN